MCFPYQELHPVWAHIFTDQKRNPLKVNILSKQ